MKKFKILTPYVSAKEYIYASNCKEIIRQVMIGDDYTVNYMNKKIKRFKAKINIDIEEID